MPKEHKHPKWREQVVYLLEELCTMTNEVGRDLMEDVIAYAMVDWYHAPTTAV